MLKHFRKLRKKSKIYKEEIIADAIFLVVSWLVTMVSLYIFDITRIETPVYEWLPPSKHIFQDYDIYLWVGLAGAIVGFFLIKIFLYGLKEEEIAWKRRR